MEKDGQSKLIMARKPTYEELEQKVKELEKEAAEHKLAEKALRAKDSVVASSISAIAIADPEGNLTYINDSFLKLCDMMMRRRFWGSALSASGRWKRSLRR